MKKKYIYFAVSVIFVIILILLLAARSCSNQESVLVDLKCARCDCLKQCISLDNNVTVSYIDSDCNYHNHCCNVNETASFVLFTEKNCVTPFLVTTTDTETGCEFYTGFLYPFSTEFSIHGGFCAWIYIKLFQNSFQSKEEIVQFCSFFNWKRFYEKILSYDNPFILDDEKICSDIAARNFSVHSFVKK